MNGINDLDLSDIITAPLEKVMDAQKILSLETIDRIDSMFDAKGEAISIPFSVTQNGVRKDTTVPLLSLINFPSLSISSTDIEFNVNIVTMATTSSTSSIETNSNSVSNTKIIGNMGARSNSKNDKTTANLSIRVKANNAKSEGFDTFLRILTDSILVTTSNVVNEDDLHISMNMKI